MAQPEKRVKVGACTGGGEGKGDANLFWGNLKEFFHVTHSMTSERCLSACANTQTGLPAAIKADATD